MRIWVMALSVNFCWLAAAMSACAQACSVEECRWTRPDVAAIPLDKLQSPHFAPAEQWRSLYCLEWRDQCTRCVRTTVRSKIACERLPGVNQSCAGDYTLCVKANLKIFDKFCVGQHGESVVVHAASAEGEDQSERHAEFIGGDSNWTYWQKVKSHWELREEQNLLAHKRAKGESPRVDDIVDRYSGIECVGTYSQEDILKLR